jgi:hypothetical protein
MNHIYGTVTGLSGLAGGKLQDNCEYAEERMSESRRQAAEKHGMKSWGLFR